MNFSGYFCLVAATVLVVFAQQSDAIKNKLDPGIKRPRGTINKQLLNANISIDPLIKLIEGFINGSEILLSARSKFLDGVLAAEKIVGKNPAAARKLTQQSCLDGISIVYTAGPPIFITLGGAFGLSKGGARQGIFSATENIQKAGLVLLSTLESGESLFNEGSEAGGTAAKESLDVYHLAIENGFAAVFYEVQKSANESVQALKNAQSSPIKLQIENRNCGVAAKYDPECSDALRTINQVAKNALRNGANPALVEELKEIVKCALDSLVQNTAEVKKMLVNAKAIAEIDTFAATTMVSAEAEALKRKINQQFVQLYLEFGDVCSRSGNQSDKEVQPGYMVLEKGNVKIVNTIKFSEQMVMNGLKTGGEAPVLAFESVGKSVNLARLVFIQSLLECAKVVFRLL